MLDITFGFFLCCNIILARNARKYFWGKGSLLATAQIGLNEDHYIYGDEERDDVEKLDKFCEYKCKIETP